VLRRVVRFRAKASPIALRLGTRRLLLGGGSHASKNGPRGRVRRDPISGHALLGEDRRCVLPTCSLLWSASDPGWLAWRPATIHKTGPCALPVRVGVGRARSRAWDLVGGMEERGGARIADTKSRKAGSDANESCHALLFTVSDHRRSLFPATLVEALSRELTEPLRF